MDLDVELGVTNNAKRDYTIHSDFDIEVETSDNWDYSKGSPRKFVYGTASIGGGANQIKIRTTNGNLEIRRSNSN